VEENFSYVFDRDFEGSSWTTTTPTPAPSTACFKDTETTEFFTAMACKIVYELAREAGKAG